VWVNNREEERRRRSVMGMDVEEGGRVLWKGRMEMVWTGSAALKVRKFACAVNPQLPFNRQRVRKADLEIDHRLWNFQNK
jgi:hypothetical protein